MSKISAHRRAYGQFFTPEQVVACCYALLATHMSPRPRLVDPACGDGAFLRYAARNLAHHEDIYGCDIDAALVASLVAEGLTNVRCADGLLPSSLPAGEFDLVVGNPPFGIAMNGRDGRAVVSEVAFLLRAIELARPGGYIGLVLPSGVLANERLRAVREHLLRRCSILAVVELPRATFRRGGTNAACSLLLLQNAPPAPGHRVFFAQAQRLDDLPAIVSAYQQQHEHDDGLQRSSWLAFLLPQTSALVQRLDVSYWRPAERQLLEHLALRYTLRPLGELVERQRGLIVGDHVRPSRGERKGPGLPYEYYQTRQFMAAGYNYASIEHCNEQAYQRLKYTAVQRNDILVSCAGMGGAGNGRVCLVTHQPGPSCTGDVFILRVTDPDPIFLFLFLCSYAGRAQLLRLQNGVGTANLSADELLQVQIPLLSPALQQTLAAHYAPVAAAHDVAMAALTHGDVPGFERARSRSEALLGQAQTMLDEVMQVW